MVVIIIVVVVVVVVVITSTKVVMFLGLSVWIQDNFNKSPAVARGSRPY